MIELDLTEGQPPTFCDVTGYNYASACLSKFMFRYVLGLDTVEPKPAADYGTATHVAMPFLQRGDKGRALIAFADSWAKSGNLDTDKYNLNNAERMLDFWLQKRIKGQTMPYDIIEPPQTSVQPETRYSDDEFAFSVDLDAALPLCGRIDAIGREKATGRIWVIEYKTASQFGSGFIEAFQLNSQIIAYVCAAAILMNEEIPGGFVEALRTSTTNPDNMCIPVFVEPHVCEGFINHFQYKTEEIMECAEKGLWPQDFGSCSSYSKFYTAYGFDCPYKTLCKSPHWRNLLSAFRVNYWKPHKGIEETENK